MPGRLKRLLPMVLCYKEAFPKANHMPDLFCQGNNLDGMEFQLPL